MPDSFTLDTLDYNQVGTLYGLNQDDINSLDEQGRRELYNQFADDLYTERTQGITKESDILSTLQGVVDELPDSRSYFNVPDVVNDPNSLLNLNSLIDSFETNEDDLLRRSKLSDLIDNYADQFTKGVDSYFRYPTLRGSDRNKLIKDVLKSELNDSIEYNKDTTLQEAIEFRNQRNTEPDIQSDNETEGPIAFSVDQAQRLLGSGVQTFGDLLGDLPGGETLRNLGQRVVQQQERDIEAGRYQPNYTKSFVETLDEDGVSASLGWIWEKVQENLASGGLAIAGAGAAAATAPISTPLSLALGGATTLGVTGLGIGEVRQELEEQGIYDPDDSDLAVGAGLVVAALDRLGGSAVIPKNEILRRLFETGAIKRIGAKAATEAGTEALQEATVIGAAALDGAEYEQSELVNRLIDSGIVGGAIGLGGATAGEVIERGQPAVSGVQPSDGQPDPVGEQAAPTSSNLRRTNRGRTFSSTNGDLTEFDENGTVVQSNLSTVATVTPETEVEGSSDSAELKQNGNTVLTYEGTNAVNELERIRDEIENTESIIPGTVITQVEDGFQLVSPFGETTTDNITQGLQTLNQQRLSRDSIIRVRGVRPEEFGQQIDIPIRQRKVSSRNQTNLTNKGELVFDNINQSIINLQNNGFQVIDNTDKRLTFYKDDLFYEVDLTKRNRNAPSRGRGRAAGSNRVGNLTVKDSRGNTIRVDDAVGSQRVVDGRGDLQTDSVQVRVPPKGIVLRQVGLEGREESQLDPANILDVADRTGGTVVLNEPDVARIEYQDSAGNTVEAVNILLLENGQLAVEVNDDQVAISEGSVEVFNNTPATSTLIDQLTNRGYIINNVSEQESGLAFTLENDVGDEITVLNNEVTRDGESVDQDQLLTQPEVVEETFEASADESIDDSYLNADEIMQRVEVIDGIPQYTTDAGDRIIFENTRIEDVPDAIRNIDLNKTTFKQVNNEINENSAEVSADTGTLNWTISDLRELAEATFGKQIADLIVFHQNSKNPASRRGAHGFFVTNSDKQGRFIHIDASSGQSLETVIDTLAEEVSHFGFNSWANSRLTSLYDRLYNIVEPEITTSLDNYIQEFGINLNNIKPSEKYLLVNEYFSKLALSIPDFANPQVNLRNHEHATMIERIRNVITPDSYERLKINLREDYNGPFFEQADTLIDTVMRLQALSTRGKGYVLEYDINRSLNDPVTIRVTSTPFGSVQNLIPNEKNAERLNRVVELTQEAVTSNVKAAQKSLYRLNPINNVLGRRITTLLDLVSKGGAVIIGERLRVENNLTRRVNRVRINHGIREIGENESYEQVFKENGIVRKSHLRQARELDEFKDKALKDKFINVAEIHNLFYDQIDALRIWDRQSPSTQTSSLINRVSNNVRRFTADWKHGRYSAYTREGAKEIAEMLKEFNSNPRSTRQTLQQKSASAQQQVESLMALPKRTAKQNRQLQKLVREANLFNRLESLFKYEVSQLQDQTVKQRALSPLNFIPEVNQAMKKRMERIIQANEHLDSGGRDLDSIAAFRGRTLDPAADADLIDFLDPITDPSEGLIHDLEQQHRIISSLKASNALAKELVNSGIAVVKGSSEQGLVNPVPFPGKDNSSSLLGAINIDSTFTREIDEILNSSRLIEQHFLTQTFSEIKRNLTVRNPFAISTNYTGSLSMVLASGHIFNTIDLYRQAGGELKNLYNQRVRTGSKSIESEIIKIMTDNNLLGTGLGGVTVEITAQGANSFFNTLRKLDDATGLPVAERLEALDNFLAKLFSFGDDVGKLLPFLSNRMMMLKEAEIVIKRNQFENNTKGEAQYNDALVEYADRRAVDRTQRETLNWHLAPSFLAPLTRDNRRVYTRDFMGHFVQLFRTLVSNHLMVFEDFASAKRWKMEGQGDLAKMYFNQAIKRSVGTGLTDALQIGYLNLGAFTIGSIFNALVNLAQDEDGDETELPIEQQRFYRRSQYGSARNITNLYTKLNPGNQVFDPLPFRDGNKLTMVALQRTSGTLAFADPITLTGELNSEAVKNAGISFINKFLALDSPTIATQIWQNVFLGEDDFGRVLTSSERIESLTRLVTPQVAEQMWRIVAGRSLIGGHEINRLYQLATVAGFKTKETTYSNVLNQYARDISQFTSNKINPSKRHAFDKLLTKQKLTDDQINAAINDVRGRNKNKFVEITSIFNDYRNLGFTDRDIIRGLSRQPGGGKKPNISQERAQRLVSGVNTLDESIVNSINLKIKELQKTEPENDRIGTQEEINAQIYNFKRALQLYR